MTTPCETQAPERDSYRETIAALERRLDEVRGERDALRACDRKTWPDMLDKATARAEKAEAERDALAERLARLSDHLFARHRHLAGLKVRGQLTTEGQSALHEIREALDVYESRLAAPRGDGR